MECPPQPIKLHWIHPPHLPPVDHTGTSVEGQRIESSQGTTWTPPPNLPTLSTFQQVSSALPFQSSPSCSSFLLQLSSSAEVDTWTPPPQPPLQVPALNASVSHMLPQKMLCLQEDTWILPPQPPIFLVAKNKQAAPTQSSCQTLVGEHQDSPASKKYPLCTAMLCDTADHSMDSDSPGWTVLAHPPSGWTGIPSSNLHRQIAGSPTHASRLDLQSREEKDLSDSNSNSMSGIDNPSEHGEAEGEWSGSPNLCQAERAREAQSRAERKPAPP